MSSSQLEEKPCATCGRGMPAASDLTECNDCLDKAEKNSDEFLSQSKPWNEYRCTRPDVNPGNDPKARQGYYIVEKSENKAIAHMRRMFPNDKTFEIRLWKENVKV